MYCLRTQQTVRSKTRYGGNNMEIESEKTLAGLLAHPAAKRDSARKLAKRIREVNLNAKIAFTKKAKKVWYAKKASLIELGLKYSEFFRVESYEIDDRLGAVLSVRIGDGGMIHVPRKALGTSDLVRLSALPTVSTLRTS